MVDTPKMFPLASNTDESAVSRVLGVTELLESIFKFLPFPLPHGSPLTKTYVMSPQALFKVQRVNRKFKDTIEGSLALKRLMFLNPVAHDGVFGSEAHGAEDRDPMKWFAKWASIAGLGLTLRHQTEFHDAGIQPYWSLSVINQSSPELWQRKEASWRRMRISCESTSGHINVSFGARWRYCTKGTVTFPLSKWFGIRYVESRRFAKSDALGDVFDTFLEIQSRSMMEHAHAMANIVAEESLID